jgi:hypothetical protein
MDQITPAHIMMIIGVFALIVPILTAIAIFFLNRFSGSGDALRNQVHALEIAQRDMEARIGANVRGEYATKDDIRRLEATIGQFCESQRQYTEAVQAMLKPIAEQLVISAARR